MSDPIISVVTPCYNAAPFLGETIRSVLLQGDDEIEHIIVDDGSSDESASIADTFARAHADRIRVLALPTNGGAAAARNRGAALARGRSIMFLDADDVLAPRTLEALHAALTRSSAGLALCPWRRLRREAGSDEWSLAPADTPLPSVETDEALRGWIACSAWAPPCAVLWTRDTFRRTGCWDETITLNDDGDLMMRALASGVTLVHSTSGCALYRTHDAERVSLSQSFMAEQKLVSQKAVYDKIAGILAAQDRLDEFSVALAVAYHKTALLGFQAGHRAFARACEARGRRLAGGRAVSPTVTGRLLERLLGLEGKETLTQALAGIGLGSKQRDRVRQLKILQQGMARGPR